MHRFFLPSSAFHGDQIDFPPDTARQISRVLRLSRGDIVAVINEDDFSGTEFHTSLQEVTPHKVRGTITGENWPATEPSHHLSLYLALTQRDKFEWVLQKCTEIGVSAFYPLVTARSLVQDAKDFSQKAERWRRILKEAAEQSGRMRIPTLDLPIPFQLACSHANQHHQIALIAWEKAHADFDRFLQPDEIGSAPARLAIMIGPEGGFSEEEIETAQQSSLIPVTLGPRILRMETAAIVMAAMVLKAVGDLKRESSGI